MKTIIKNIAEQNKLMEKEAAAKMQSEINNPATDSSRRSFLKKAALGGISLGALMSLSIEDTIAQTTSKVSRSSSPSDLIITDMRYALTWGPPVIRIDTNQGIYGLGEVRNNGDVRYALMLKSRILGQNPCNVEMLFRIIKQFGYHGRQAGGVCGVEMALWDLCGKAYGVPAWQLLGGRYRDKVRIYADTPTGKTIEEQQRLIKNRTEELGYTWLKIDLSINQIRHIPDTLTNDKGWRDNSVNYYGLNAQHQFTQTQITDKGLEEMAKILEGVRNIVGWEMPIFADHFGEFDYNNGIRLGRVLEKYRLAAMEDVIPWWHTEQWKKLSDALETPVMTGEDIYLLAGFKPLIDNQAVDIVHPDLASSGGLLETKKIGDYAEEHGIAMALHQGGTPISFTANVHCAAATQNFLSLEHHRIDLPWWESTFKTTDGRPLITKGFANVPLSAPGLGLEINEEVFKKHMSPKDNSYFAPTPEWNDKVSGDRLWS